MSNVTKSCRDISQLSGPAQKACNLFLSACKNAGLNVLITETYRSQERQNYLYEQGRSRGGQIVTWTKNSRHTSRRAWDICKNVSGQEYSDTAFFYACGDIAKSLGITWGGTWSTPDTPHFEIDIDWNYESEDIDMTKAEELQAQIDELKAVTNKMIYNYVDENMPSWARPTVQKLVGKGVLKGNDKGELGLTDDMLKILVVIDRTGILG